MRVDVSFCVFVSCLCYPVCFFACVVCDVDVVCVLCSLLLRCVILLFCFCAVVFLLLFCVCMHLLCVVFLV